MGLEEGHPEKVGVLVDITGLADEIRTRLAAKNNATTKSSRTTESGLETQIQGLAVEVRSKAEDTSN
jgi:hypothetical protein